MEVSVSEERNAGFEGEWGAVLWNELEDLRSSFNVLFQI
jgi:hypothetical protein